ncbi:hypothetical protein [Cognatishimia sp.]|uniref:hypothetical protein n=1 Tax=Cognatishimia sp. TaxID=2211648 RepID=UPI0035113B7E
MFRITLAVCLLATPALADNYICKGSDPDWELTINGSEAIFDFERKNTFQIPDTAIAEGRDWPRAKPIIGDFDTAIAILDKASCETGPFTVDILTQRGQTPLLLTGCCEVVE